ncbi:hypothetical protein ACX93W_22110 [Paenibacillus sp. CAU 1782]
MKKVLLATLLLLGAVLVFVFAIINKNNDFSINAEDIQSVDMYQFSSDRSEVQRMEILEQSDIAAIVDGLSQIKPNPNSVPLDGNYYVRLNKKDGSTFIYVNDNGEVTTSNGFLGRVENDNIMNRLWAGLDYPVQNVTEDELPTDLLKVRQ